MVKVPARPGLDPSRVRSDNPSGQPKGPSRVRSVRASARRSSFPRESHPVKSRPARVSACRGFVRSLSRSAKGLFRQGLGPSRVRSVTLPRSAKGRSVKVPARPGLGPSKVRSARASARRSSSPRESHPVKSRPARVSACQGFVRSPSPGQQRAVPSRSRPVRGSARQRSGPPEPRPAGVPPRESRTPSSPDPPGSRPVKGSFGHPPPVNKGPFRQGPGPSGARPVKGPVRPSLGSPEFLPGRVAPPLHVRVPTAPFPLSSPFMSSSSPLPLRRLLPLRRPTPPSCVPVRLSRRGRDSTAGGGIARAKMWNGISGAERRAAAASGAPLPRPPGSRPEPTPGRQTSRERGGGEASRKRKNKEQERVFEQKGPKPAKRRSGRAAKGRPVEQCRCTEMKRSSGKAVPR